MKRLWQVYRVADGASVELGLCDEGWLDTWSGRLFCQGWTLQYSDSLEWYKIVSPTGGERYEVYQTSEWSRTHE